MVSHVVDIALSVTHLGKVIRGHFDLVRGILNLAFKYGPDRIEQKQLRDSVSTIHMLRTLVMELPKIQDCRADIVRATKINILALQKLAKDCLSNVLKE